VLLLVEDLHWIDAETQALLDSLVESLPGARLLLLVTYRREYQHSWGQKSYYTQLRLDPLPPPSVDQLLHALLGHHPSLAPLRRLLIERAEGNPFFLEEGVRALVETRALRGGRGQYSLATDAVTLQIPETVQAVLAGRIDRLPPEKRHLLQTAAVIGVDVPFALLRDIAGLPEEAVSAGLARLQATEFLYEANLFPELEYAFTHALTHEVAYGGLPQERRRAVHARIVEAIETAHRDRLGEHIERLAHHASRASYGRRPCTISGSPESRRPRGPRSRTLGPGSSRRSEPSATSPRAGRPPSWPSTSASTSGTRSSRSAIGRARGTISTRRRCSPGCSATSAGSRGSPPSW
jgi:predicted ATPase